MNPDRRIQNVVISFKNDMPSVFILCFLCGGLVAGSVALAEAANAPQPFPQAPSPKIGLIDDARMELQSDLGASKFFSPNGSKGPNLNYSFGNYWLENMLDAPHGSDVFRGDKEFLVETFYGFLFGPGHWLAGGNLVKRYNFVHEDSKCFPESAGAFATLTWRK